MKWTAEKIHILRCRLGWTQAELARNLKCDSELISQWEAQSDQQLSAIEMHIDALTLLDRLAESASDQVFHSPLAESILDETQSSQVDADVVKRRFYENN